ncbi:MAG: PHP domain-containing protein, partial [Bacteroidota bacterium]|nr:PHP domain-containing protein [Bacteroidota bacterium]
MNYSELQVTTNFSFLRGASHPDELVEQAAALGYSEIGITDRNSLAGIVRGHMAAKSAGIRIIPGCRLELLDGPALLAYPTNIDGYTQLSALLTTGNLRAEKGDCHLYKADIYRQLKDTRMIVVSPDSLNAEFEFDPSFEKNLKEYLGVFGNRIYLGATRRYLGDDSKQLFRLSQISSRLHIPLLATNDVHYHEPDRRQLQDILTCIREKCTIHNAGYRLHQNAERFLKPKEEMARLFKHYPEALRATQEITEACQFSLNELKYVYPEEITTEGRTPQEEIAFLAWKGARAHFGDQIPEIISSAIHHELKFIKKMNYAAYFLTVYDIVRYARENGILCQGRGSAANSTICYCLGITS